MAAPPPSYAIAERLRRLVRTEQDERVAARAIESGLISAERLAEARAAADEEGRSLLEVIRARGWLDASALSRLEETLAREEFARPSVWREAELPADAREAAADPSRRLGDFVLVALLGRGGAGEVWKAWDRRLDRWVAVKISVASVASGAARDRFEREALATARLAHPNIVPIYQVGAERERSYLVMPYIEGVTLDRAALDARRAVEVIRTAALAVEHAHQHGIVHRDLKPANIIVDRAGTVFVLDFGLVYLREEQATGITRPGDLLGTAAFMTPEQARGDADARSATIDVYGLGATLYALVTGQPPFRGDSFAAVVAKVLTAEPTAPRALRPDLDPRIERVIRKAMNKDPAQRYASAAALADDLQRILEDKDVSARPQGATKRLGRSLRRRPLIVASAAALVAMAVILAGARARMGSEQRAALETVRQMARAALETALRLRRAGDTAGMREALPPLAAAYEHVRSRRLMSAEVEYLMGRMQRALMNEEAALEHHDRALALDSRYAPALYERVVLRSARYGRALDEALESLRLQAGGAAVDVHAAERARPALVTLREEIVADLRRLQALPLAAPDAQAARGILAYHERQYGKARELLDEVVKQDPLREEAWEALARAAEGRQSWGEAESAYTRALSHDRGYVPYLVGRCELRGRNGRSQDAEKDAAAAIELDPNAVRAWLCRGTVRTHRGHQLMLQGQDPTALFDAAEKDFAEALRRSELPSALRGRGTVLRYRAMYRERVGKDPTPDLDLSEQALARAIALAPSEGQHWVGRARTRTRRAIHRMNTGGDPSADFGAAEGDFAEASRLSPRRSEVWSWRGDLETQRGLHLLDRGEDPEPAFGRAEGHFARALEVYSSDPWTWAMRAEMRLGRARAAQRHGRDARSELDAAEADMERALKLGPTVAEFWVERATIRLTRADLPAVGKADATRDQAQAEGDLEQAMKLDASYAEAWAVRALLRRARGDRSGARSDLRRAVELKPLLRTRYASLLATLDAR